MKSKKITKEKLRAKADKLLMDYIRLKHKDELCWVCCNKPVEVGHHFVSKKNSSALRFYLPNIIPICKSCHYLIHNQPHLVEPKLCFKLGEAWYADLMEVKRQSVKFNLEWAQMQYDGIQYLMEELSKNQCK